MSGPHRGIAPWTALRSYEAVGAAAAVVLLYPGYFVYHWGVYYEVWPAVAGGLYGPVCAAALLVGAPFLLPVLLRSRRAAAWWALILLIIGHAAVTGALHFLIGEGLGGTRAAATQTGEMIVLSLGLAIIGFAAPWGDRRLAAVIVLGGFVSVGLLGWSLVRDAGLGFGSPLHDAASSYQGLARSLLVAFLIAIVVLESKLLRSLAAMTGLVGLFFMGARSEFVAFGVGLLALVAVASRGLFVKVAIPVVFALALTVLFGIAEGADRGSAGARMTELLDYASSTSWQRRVQLTDGAVKQIRGSPLLGAYGEHQAFGGTAGYAHNYLSAYAAFGLGGFLGFTALVLGTVLISTKKVIASRGDPVWRLAFALGVACLLLVTLSKSIYWTLPALTWGLIAAGFRRESQLLRT